MESRLMLVVVVASVTLHGCGPQTSEMQLIDEAAEAMGGARNIGNVETLLLEAEGRQFRLGQNMDPDDPLPYWELDDYRREVDLTTGRWRVIQERTSFFLTGNPSLRQEQTFGVDGDVGYDVAEDGTVRRVNEQVTADRMVELYHHPVALIKLALTEGSTVGNMRQEDGQDVVDVTSAAGDTYTIFIDPDTRFPSRIVSMGYNANLGDVVLTTRFDDYWEAGGLGGFGPRLTMPRQILSSIDNFTTWDLRVASSVDQDFGDLSAPEEARSAAVPMFEASVEVEDIADGVWKLAGQSHHSVLVEFEEFTALIEAPHSEARTLAVIAKAREIQPDKPLQYVVNTHHHFDHSAGIRAAVSEGLTVITHASNEAFYRDLVQRPHTLHEDALLRSSQELSLELVQGYEPYELSDGSRTLIVARVPRDEHASAILMASLPRERLLFEADSYSPNARVAPFAPNLLEAVNDMDWEVDRIVPLHGPVVEFAALEETVEAESKRR